MTEPRTTSSRTQLVLIVGIALASLGGAYLLFHLAGQGVLWGTSNHGTFVRPALTVDELNVRTDTGAPFETGGTWWLWVVPRGPCDAPCRQAVHRLRQLHVLLHRDAGRVRRALVGADAGAASLLAEYPRLEPLSGNLRSVVDRLGEGVYVIDPLGNVVLHYRFDQVGEPLLDDLEQLLKVSRVG